MREAVVVDALRTPIGRYGGSLKDVRPDDLAALVIKKIVERNHLAADVVDEVFFGATNQSGEDNRNLARMALLLAGLPATVPGVTVNRLCGSGMEAVVQAARAVWSNQGDIFISGGAESMTRAPYVMAKADSAFSRQQSALYDTTIGWRFTNPKLAEMYYPYGMGETAENVAEKWGISRHEQDEFALISQQKAFRAQREGRFGDEMIPVVIPGRRGGPVVVEADEHPRPDITLDKLAKLPSAFREGGTVTAGNSSGINDGAAAVLVMSAAKARELGLQPIARIISNAVAGVDPAYMGIGPVPASLKALERVGLKPDQIDLWEINEAFASQSLACIRDLGLDQNKVNVNGGAIALGHPLGCTGARIIATLLHEMKRRLARYGVAAMCIGVGQGIATVFELLHPE